MAKNKSRENLRLRNSTAEFLTFAYQTGGDGVEVRVEDNTIWLSQKNIGQLFETTPENVLMDLKNIFAGAELAEESAAKVFLAVQAEGQRQVQRSILQELAEDSVAKFFLATASDGKNCRIRISPSSSSTIKAKTMAEATEQALSAGP
jgi:hypothetical protein